MMITKLLGGMFLLCMGSTCAMQMGSNYKRESLDELASMVCDFAAKLALNRIQDDKDWAAFVKDFVALIKTKERGEDTVAKEHVMRVQLLILFAKLGNPLPGCRQ